MQTNFFMASMQELLIDFIFIFFSPWTNCCCCCCLRRVHDFIEKHPRKCLRSKIFRSVHPLIILRTHIHPTTHCSHAKITFYHSARVLNYFSFNYIVHRKYISSVVCSAWQNSLSPRICMPSLSLSIILCFHTLHCHVPSTATHRKLNFNQITKVHHMYGTVCCLQNENIYLFGVRYLCICFFHILCRYLELWCRKKWIQLHTAASLVY